MYLDSDDSDPYSSASEAGIYDDDLIQAEGIHATIYRVELEADQPPRSPSQDDVPGLRAVKSVTTFKNARLEPHDIRTEAYALSRLRHIHIIELLGASYSHSQKLFQLTMPFIPLTLHDILENPRCSPYQLPKLEQAPKGNSNTLSRFSTLSKSFLYQITSAVAFLHTRRPPIAHRDLKPSNVLVQPEDGCIKICDFGIAWDGRPRGHGASLEEPRGDDGNGRLNLDAFFNAGVPKPEWEELPERMCCQVSSGPYRAPELLFAPRKYDAYATDLWSLGVLASNFFTSLWFDPKHSQAGSRLDEFDWDALVPEEERESAHGGTSGVQLDPTIPFNLPNSGMNRGTWHRAHLFDSTRGEIGLVASIFKILGTPTEETWPGFKDLPAASALVFNPVPSRALAPLLPNLMYASHHAAAVDSEPNCSVDDLGWAQERDHTLRLIQALLRYPPQSRTSATDLLSHPYFTKGYALLPPICASTDDSPRDIELHRGQREANTLPELISRVLASETGETSNSS